jgi:hypothetical protein
MMEMAFSEESRKEKRVYLIEEAALHLYEVFPRQDPTGKYIKEFSNDVRRFMIRKQILDNSDFHNYENAIFAVLLLKEEEVIYLLSKFWRDRFSINSTCYLFKINNGTFNRWLRFKAHSKASFVTGLVVVALAMRFGTNYDQIKDSSGVKILHRKINDDINNRFSTMPKNDIHDPEISAFLSGIERAADTYDKKKGEILSVVRDVEKLRPHLKNLIITDGTTSGKTLDLIAEKVSRGNFMETCVILVHTSVNPRLFSIRKHSNQPWFMPLNCWSSKRGSIECELGMLSFSLCLLLDSETRLFFISKDKPVKIIRERLINEFPNEVHVVNWENRNAIIKMLQSL